MSNKDKQLEEVMASFFNSKEGELFEDYLLNQIDNKGKKLLRKDLSKEELYKESIEYHNTKKIINRILSFRIDF